MLVEFQQQLAYSVEEAAAACACRPFHIRRAVKNCDLTSHSIGRRSVLLRSDLIEWLRTRPQTKSPRRIP
jgi:hypothetical protein